MLLVFPIGRAAPNGAKLKDGFEAVILENSRIINEHYIEIDADKYAEILRKHSKLGLGDAVHSVAHPIAMVIDGILGTNLGGCVECEKRREWLNNL